MRESIVSPTQPSAHVVHSQSVGLTHVFAVEENTSVSPAHVCYLDLRVKVIPIRPINLTVGVCGDVVDYDWQKERIWLI